MNNRLINDPFNVRQSGLGSIGLGNRAFPQQFNPALRILQGGAQQLCQKVLADGAKAIESGVQAIESSKQAVEQAVADSGIFDTTISLSAEKNPRILPATGEEHLAIVSPAYEKCDRVREKEAEREVWRREKEEDSLTKGHTRTRMPTMSTFAVPQNLPIFTNPQRELENRVWGSSGTTHARGNGNAQRIDYRYGSDKSLMGGLQTQGTGFFETAGKNYLPMYKDKPYSYAASRRRKSIWKDKRVLGLGAMLFILILWLLGFLGGYNGPSEMGTIPSKSTKGGEGKGAPSWQEKQESVKDAFKLSWDAYERYAWGKDEFHPVSKSGNFMTPKGMGWIIVDALDTLILMNLTSRLTHAREWVGTQLDYEQDQDVNTFETTIRMLGGFLSAHYLSTEFPNMAPLSEDDPGTAGEDLYLEKAKDLADRIVGAFDSPSGVPYASFNLKTLQGIPSHDEGGASSTAEAATLQLELKYLSKLTGEKYYWEKAEKVMQVIDDNGMEDGLLPIYIYANNGHFRGSNVRLGSRGDSYYEYLIKQYLQTSKQEPVYEEMWNQALAGVRKHLVTYSEPSKFTIIAERPDGLHEALSPKMDHLVCFMGGTIALGATGGLTEAEAKKLPTWNARKEEEMKLARELTKTCVGMYKYMATGLAPEIAHFYTPNPAPSEDPNHIDTVPDSFPMDENAEWKKDFNIKPNDVHNLQRPETIESLFYMWRITEDNIYREWGWDIFQAFTKYTTVADEGGFTSLGNAAIVPPDMGDNMESFWLAETLKYFYLLFGSNDVLPLDQIVINTEAHPFPRFELGKLFSTGWKRKPRDENGKILKGVQAIIKEQDANREKEAGEKKVVVVEEVKVGL